MPAASVGGTCLYVLEFAALKELPAQCEVWHSRLARVVLHTQKNISVSYVRARAKGDLSAVRSLYGSDVSRYW